MVGSKRLMMSRRIRTHTFSTWAEGLQDADAYLRELPSRDLSSLVIRPEDESLLRKARIEADWEGENIRCFSSMTHPALEFLPARAFGSQGLAELARTAVPQEEESWIFFIAHQPNIHEKTAGKLFEKLTARGHRIFLWGFDEVSRRMPCFRDIAPHLSILIHDEFPLDPAGRALLAKNALVEHRSWVANLLPFATPFQEEVEKKIAFLGSPSGLSPHRQRQIDFLKNHFKDRFIAIHDGSVPVADRAKFASWKVHFCPEGRHFATPGMRYSHTDRPFWAGCMGQVPVIEDSEPGGRLEKLTEQKLVLRYPHGDLAALATACESALEIPTAERRRLYEHFNRHETIGPAAVELIARYQP